MLSQPKTAVHQQTAKIFTKAIAAPQRELDHKLAFEKADRLLEKNIPADGFTNLHQ
jgi:hypothetical protein